ncbi:MAG: PAS domain S-box protein, partial [Myxococcales bacterium]|nr:PAS domain S-box protein [Myxococcales bacterium]
LERDVSSRSIYQAQRLDGTPLWVEADVVVLHDASGAMIGTQRTLRDITDRRETEEALRILSTGVAHLSGEALLDELVRHLTRLLEADVGVVGALSKSDARSSRTIGLWVDGAAESTVGFALHELPPIGTEGPLVVAEGAQERFPGSPALAHFAAQGCALAPLIDSQGRRIGVIGVLSRAPLRRPSRIAGLLGLFAVLASANLERHREETKLHDLFEYSPDAVLMVNEAGGIVMANIRAQELLGYSREELLQANIDAMVPGESRAFHAILRRRFLSQPRARPMGSLKEPLRALRKDGATVPVDISLGPIRADEEILIVVSIRDMTQHVLAEERRASLELRLRHAQKLEALGTLAGGIAHDFNNILGALVANTELARTEIDRGHVVAGRLEEIAAAADRATLLVRQILAFSRRQPPRRAITTLAPVVDEAARLLRATLPARIQLKVEIGEAVPNVLADATQLHQVIMNLGTNAWHAIDDAGGTVTIRLDAHEGSGRAPSRRFARISVSDTGSGMDAALLDRIFEPFFTTKPVGEGSGLGLSVVHGIVTEHGGELTIDTALGRGTTITILLPAVEGEAIRPASDESVQGRGDWRVLMIDDDPILATVGEALLVRLGYQVRAFTDPVAAIVAFRGAPEDYDVVITDFNMPTMSGVDVAREVAAMRSEVPIVLVSGHSEHTDEELALAGVRFRLDKPYNLKSLDRILSRVRSELGGGTRK